MSKTTTITVELDSKALFEQIKVELIQKYGMACTNQALFDYMVKYIHGRKENFIHRIPYIGRI